jgi:hypothetical protein
MADVLAKKHGEPEFSWGSLNLVKPGEARAAYLDAIHSADRGDYRPLINFSRE